MYVKIDQPKKIKGGDNKGSSYNILTYLEKENEGKEEEEKQRFFSQDQEGLYKNQVMDMLDNNHKNLSHKDFKFYSLSISPSHYEQQHILKHIGVKRDVNSIEELSKSERELYEKELKSYTRGVMDLYAANFNRGLTGKDLVYAAKIERNRKYNHLDKNVIHNKKINSLNRKLTESKGLEKREIKEKLKELGDYKRTQDGIKIKEGMLKPGLNSHIHVVVSRNSIPKENSKGKLEPIKLSPLAKARHNDKHKIGGKECTIGFDNEAFKKVSAEYFNDKYSYMSKEGEKYQSRLDKYDNKAANSHEKTTKALQNAKHHILKGTFHNEEKIIKTLVNPKKELEKKLHKMSIIQTIKTNLKDVALGKIFEK